MRYAEILSARSSYYTAPGGLRKSNGFPVFGGYTYCAFPAGGGFLII